MSLQSSDLEHLSKAEIKAEVKKFRKIHCPPISKMTKEQLIMEIRNFDVNNKKEVKASLSKLEDKVFHKANKKVEKDMLREARDEKKAVRAFKKEEKMSYSPVNPAFPVERITVKEQKAMKKMVANLKKADKVAKAVKPTLKLNKAQPWLKFLNAHQKDKPEGTPQKEWTKHVAKMYHEQKN